MEGRRCVIIGASPVLDIEMLKREVLPGDYVVCADGGYTYAHGAGIKADLIIGDFDSSVYPVKPDSEIIKLPVTKDDTDMHYCIKECIKRGYKNFVLYGGTGGRPDHTFANLSSLLYIADKGCTGFLEDNDYRCLILKKGKMTIISEKGKGFSIFPFGCDDCRVTLKGFLYELESGILSSDFPLGVSNTINSDRAVVTVYRGTALIYIQK